MPVPRGYATLTVDLCEMLSACLCLEKAGCPWRHLPREFGPWQTVRIWHDRFRADGLWSDIATLLTRAVRARQGREPEPTTAIPDSQSVASGPQKGPRGACGNKLVRGIKRHVLTCSLGFVLAALVFLRSASGADRAATTQAAMAPFGSTPARHPRETPKHVSSGRTRP